MLFIGESRPDNGTFFYDGNSNLARYTREAFSPDGGPVPEMERFLEEFQAAGCFLVDLCPQSVNQLPHVERGEARLEGERALATTLAELRPLTIVVVMRGIADNVEQAILQAELSEVPVFVLPFPAMGHQRAYVAGLRQVLVELREAGVLDQ
ncbi:MAG: hypothetical protein NDI84_07575 [Steroidobacteraceae bacterium]|nr:hypothetical protein [Steroidobacteraceae bacterium]